MILVDCISKSFGSLRAVREVSFELPRGQIAGLLGPNGAGKSTTIRMITGFLTPDSGRISIAGHDIQSQPTRAKSVIGYLPESAPIYPEMSVRGYLKHRAKLYGVPGRTISSRIDHAMGQTRITDVAKRRVGQLSKGYRQRVGLAAALVHDPKVLILDEPTNGLDPTQIREARSLIRELSEDRTTLLCSHILPEVERTCDRVIIMAGRTDPRGWHPERADPQRPAEPQVHHRGPHKPQRGHRARAADTGGRPGRGDQQAGGQPAAGQQQGLVHHRA